MRRPVNARAAALLAALLLAPGAAAQSTAAPRGVSSPATVAIDSAQLARAFAHAATLPEIRSLLVARDGRLVGERYFHGAGPDTRFNVKSASKSILSALVGIAARDGYLRLDQPALDFFPEYAAGEVDPRKRAITIRHLVSMTAGLESTSFGRYGSWVNSPDWVRYVWQRPVVAQPGSRLDYSTGSTHLLSAILTRATGMSTLEYLDRALLRPLGIQRPRWARDPQGVYFGGNDMYLTARDLLRFGELYLDGGRHGGEQVVPGEWVRDSWRPGLRSRISGHRYGYGWWVDEFDGRTVNFAWGYGGQYVFIVPSQRLVVVMTHTQKGEQKESAYRLFESYVLPAVR